MITDSELEGDDMDHRVLLMCYLTKPLSELSQQSHVSPCV